MTFESNRFKHSSGYEYGYDFGGTIGTSEGPDHKTLYACIFLSPGSQQSRVRHRKPLHHAPREMRRSKPAVRWEGGATTQEERMSVFGNIVSAIFGSKHAAGVTAAAGSASAAP